jgi:hypothetical protein
MGFVTIGFGTMGFGAGGDFETKGKDENENVGKADEEGGEGY